ncbi:MAG TPA: hypothetical protein VFH78_07810 [Candidatus Thermoplasmatota archaeon]|nr:hypothetical protein [Candidatus Thermoplasmatota archaeon]
MRAALICGLFVLAIIATPSLVGAAGTRAETKTYIGSADPVAICGLSFLMEINKGCASFGSHATDVAVTIVATDSAALPVSMEVCQPVANNACAVHALGCGSVSLTVAEGFVPGAPVTVAVTHLPRIHMPFGAIGGGCATPGPVTTGTLTATFTLG